MKHAKVYFLALVFLVAVNLLLSQSEARPPVTQDKILEWISLPEAERPSEEIISALREFSTDFQLTSDIEARIRKAAESAERPPDLVRQVIQATRDNWILDRIRLLSTRKDGLLRIADMVRERGVRIPYSAIYAASLLTAGADEPVLTLLWPPLAPEKPRFTEQLWRIARHNVDPVPVLYDPYIPRGDVELDAVVDGRILFVPKHDTLFYNVICGADVDIKRVHFSSPVPHVSPDRLEYTVEYRGKKPRGKIYVCPQDPQCQKASDDRKKNPSEALCSWEDLPDQADLHGFPNTRFIADDDKPGRAEYSLTLHWAVIPYTLEAFAGDLRKYGFSRTKQRTYDWGVSFGNDARTQAKMREIGADPDTFELMGLGRVYRRSNLIAPKIH